MRLFEQIMAFLGCAVLGVVAGGLVGFVGGFLTVQVLMAVQPPTDCREGACGIAVVIFTFYSMLAGGGLGLVIGLWRAWRLCKSPAQAE